jgi:hypothetical protein
VLEPERPDEVLFSSSLRVTEAATSWVVPFVASVTDLEMHRMHAPVHARVDGRHAAVSFRGERLITAERLPARSVGAAVAQLPGRRRLARIHANLDRHAAAARRCLSVANDDADAAAAAAASWNAEDLSLGAHDRSGRRCGHADGR